MDKEDAKRNESAERRLLMACGAGLRLCSKIPADVIDGVSGKPLREVYEAEFTELARVR